jgi:glycosyltransferase involved in cell wall biosynthesis
MYNTANISALVSTYNREDTIRNTIKSMISQTVPLTEIIVVDDGSTDRSESIDFEIVDSSTRAKTKAKYLKQGNAGESAAPNLGLTHATKDWIAINDIRRSMEAE